MLHKVRIVAGLTALACAAALTACTDDGDPPDGGLITVTTMRGAFLQAADIGPTWRPPTASADPNQMVALCGGAATPPPLPPGAEVVSAPLVDEGSTGAQTLTQTALVYADEDAAEAGLASLRALADTCPATVNQPAQTTADRNEPAYTETARTTPMDEEGWTGFVVQRHKAYESSRGISDTAIAVVSKRNVVVVDAYAVYRLGNVSPDPSAPPPSGPPPSTSPQFDSDWKKLVGTVLNRVG